MIGGISMRKKQEIEQFCASQEVIRNYIDYVKLQGGNPAHHQARVLVNKCGKRKQMEEKSFAKRVLFLSREKSKISVTKSMCLLLVQLQFLGRLICLLLE